MKLHRDLRVTQKTAWFLLQRIRESFAPALREAFEGPVEVDETYVGGKEKNRRNAEKTFSRGVQGKASVVGIRDRETNRITAQVVGDTTRETLEGFVMDHTASGATVYTDEHKSYGGLKEYYEHEAVKYGVSEYVKDQAHINGMESFQAGVSRRVSPGLSEAPASLREPVRREAQYAGDGYSRADDPRRRWAGRETPTLQKTD